MISYKTLTMQSAFEEAAQDTATWNEEERAALAAIAAGLTDNEWNNLYMGGAVQKDGKEWDGTKGDLRPRTAGVKKNWRGTGWGRAWAKGHKPEFLIHSALEGWNIGLLE